LKVRAKGRPGHGSMPHGDNAVAHLARAITRLTANGLPYHLTGTAAGFLDAASEAVGGSFGGLLQALKSPAHAKEALEEMGTHELQPFFYAILHNTATPTGLKAGHQTNVIPGQAEVTIDGRTLPGSDTEAFLAELKKALDGDEPGRFEYEVTMDSPPLETSQNTALFATLANALNRHEPDAGVVPYLMTGATDAKYLSLLGVPSFFGPRSRTPEASTCRIGSIRSGSPSRSFGTAWRSPAN